MKKIRRIKKGTETERFWAHVDKDGAKILDTQCWEWTRPRTLRGYGVFFMNSTYRAAHRASWQLHQGDIGDLCVLHRCDNPPCIRPDHLFLGTFDDNNKDKAKKGRAPKGEGHKSTKVSDQAILEIRKRAAAGESHRVIAEDYDLSQGYTSRVVRGHYRQSARAHQD